MGIVQLLEYNKKFTLASNRIIRSYRRGNDMVCNGIDRLIIAEEFRFDDKSYT